jgi:hypothetical protein
MTALTDPSVGLSTKDLRTVNMYRLYLQVFFISDIVRMKGNAITPWEIIDTKSETRTSTWNFIVQQKPPKFAWKMWALVLHDTFGDGVSIDFPLGSWLLDNNHQNNEWWLDQHS